MTEAVDAPAHAPAAALKTETKTEEETETTAKTIVVADDVKSGLQERFKFFFSDANVRHDKFMRKFLLRQEGVPVDALLRFKTISKYTKEPDVLCQVAREIEDLVVSDDGKTISRKVAFTLDKMKENTPLTLYVANIAVSNERYDVTTDEFKNLFDNFAGLAMVKLCMKQIFLEGEKRTKETKPIKTVAHGSALVEFDTVAHLQEAADQLLTLKDGVEVEPKVKLELKGRTLSVITLKEHEAEKQKAKKEQNGDKEKSGEKSEAGAKRKSQQKDPSIESYVFDWKPKCVIKIEELASSCDREAITEAVLKALGVRSEAIKEMNLYVDYSRGQKDGAIRWEQPNEDIDVVLQKLVSGDVLVAGDKVKAALLEGDAEKEYWEKFIDFKTKQLQQRGQERGRKRHKR